MIKEYKSGVSMIILAITIIVMIILATAGIAITSTVIKNSKKVTFAEDLQKIEDAVEEYYIDHNELPKIDTQPAGVAYIQYTKSEFVGFQDPEDVTILNEELAINADDSDNNIFYVLDVSKIKITSAPRGMNLENQDQYVISKDTHKVYYFPGYLVSGEKYYSRTSRLVDIEQNIVAATGDSSITTISTMGNIHVTKNTELPTKIVTLTITGTLAEGETLKYDLASPVPSYATTIASLPATISFSSANITGVDIQNFAYNPTIYIIKVMGSTSQAIPVDISNLDITIPTIPASISVNRTSTDFNYLLLSGTVYYDYYTKIDETNVEVPYYDEPPTYSAEYLESFGKNTISGVKLPKNIQSIQAIIIDDAGNKSAVTLIDNIAVD